MKTRIHFIYALLAFLAAEAIQYTVVICGQMIYGVILGIQLGLEKETKEMDPLSISSELGKAMSQDILYLISVLAVILCGILFFFFYRNEIKGERRGSLRETFTVQNVIMLMILGLGCQLFISGIMSVVQKYFVKFFADYEKQLKMLTGGNIIIVLCLMIFIAPVAEELIFRGYILHKANRAIPFWGANLLQAMLFGVYHMNFVQGIYAAVLGFLLGMIYYKFKTILAPILLHMAVNASSLLMGKVPDHMLSYYILIILGGILITIVFYFVKITQPVALTAYDLPNEFLQSWNSRNNEE